MRSWRKMTWAILIWTVLMAVWIFAGANAASQTPTSSSAEEVGKAIGTGIGVTMVFFLWFIGFIILSIVWFMSRPKNTVTVYGPQGQQVSVSEKEAANRVKKGWTYQIPTAGSGAVSLPGGPPPPPTNT